MGKRESKWQKSQGNKYHLQIPNRLSSFVHLHVLSKLMEEVMNWRDDPHSCWTISVTVSYRYVHLEIFRYLQGDLNPWPLWCQCSALTNWAIKSLRCEQVNLLGSCVLVKCGWKMNNWRSDLHTCWTIWAIVSWAPDNFQVSSIGFKPRTK